MIVTVTRDIPQTSSVQSVGIKPFSQVAVPAPMIGEVNLVGIPGPPGPPGPAGPAGETLTLLEYIYNAGAPPPIGSQLRLNTSVQVSAVSVYITKSTSLGLDPSVIVRLLDSNYRLVIQDKNDSTKYQRYDVVGTPTEFATYFQIPVIWTDGGDPIIEQAVKLALITVGSSVNITVSDTPPSSPAINDLWVDTT